MYTFFFFLHTHKLILYVNIMIHWATLTLQMRVWTVLVEAHYSVNWSLPRIPGVQRSLSDPESHWQQRNLTERNRKVHVGNACEYVSNSGIYFQWILKKKNHHQACLIYTRYSHRKSRYLPIELVFFFHLNIKLPTKEKRVQYLKGKTLSRY